MYDCNYLAIGYRCIWYLLHQTRKRKPKGPGRTLRQLDPIDVDWVVHSSEAWHWAETAATLKATKLPRHVISNDFKRYTVYCTFFWFGCSFDWTSFSIFSSCGVRPLGSVSSSPPTCPCGLVGCAGPKTATHACRGSQGEQRIAWQKCWETSGIE